jgi:hypothetical protein
MNGYSKRLIDDNKAANANKSGVKLGRLCIKLDIPVAHVADYCKVSRMTVYNWFKGDFEPSKDISAIVQKLTNKLASRSS